MKDELGRSINYLRISVTDRCNLRCRYCMPEEGILKKEHGEVLSLEEIYEIVKACTGLGIDKVRLTGGEPLVRKGITGLVESIAGLSAVQDIAMTTNGLLLNKYAFALKEAGLHRLNISLDTLDEDKYRYMTRGGELSKVLEGIEAAREAGLYPIKLNTVLVKGFNEDEIGRFIELTREEYADVRFIELMPIGQASGWAREKYVPNSAVLESCRELLPVEDSDRSSPARYYRLPGGKGRIGLINPISHRFCSYCNRIRLTADGKLKPCLHSNNEIDVKAILRSGSRTDRLPALQEAVGAAISSKPARHDMNSTDYEPIERDMFRIGG